MIHLKQLPPGFPLPPQKPRTASKPRQRAKTPGKAPEPSEREIQRNIVSYLATVPRSAWTRYNGGALRDGGRFIRFTSRKGHPDIAGIVDGMAVYIEVKAAKGRPTADQLACHDEFRLVGAVVIVARSVDDVRTALEMEGLLP